MIELALQTKRKEDQRGNTPGLSMFEPAPNFGQIIFPGRCSSAFLVASTVERAEYRGPRATTDLRSRKGSLEPGRLASGDNADAAPKGAVFNYKVPRPVLTA